MKRFIFLLVGFVFFSIPAWANHSNNLNINQGQSFIFMENGIEFSIFRDGQFDFFIPNYGPNLNVGINNANVSFSFNTGNNYNPYVQYDRYGAVIQIQNTPIFYDNFGRVNQIGSVLIYYNNYGFVNRIGGMQILYRNNVFWRQRGFINRFNRRYVWRPWHRFYAIPASQFCLLSVHPYRQFYAPVRHIYYRPYRNNVRRFNFNRNNPRVRQRANRSNQRYAQRPRTRAERQIRSQVERRHREILQTRNTRVANVDANNTRRSAGTRNNNRTTSEVRSRRATLANARLERTERKTQNRRANEVSRKTNNRRDNVSQKRSVKRPSVTRSRSTSNKKATRAGRTSNNNRSVSTRSSRSRL